MKINEMVHNYFKKIKSKRFLKKSAILYSGFLKSGTYNILKQNNCIILESESFENLKLIKGYFDSSNSGKSIVIKSNGNCDYTAMLVCGNDSSFKFFDFKTKCILTIFTKANDLEVFLSTRPECFPGSTILDVDREHLIVKENLIVDESHSEKEKFISLVKFENNFLPIENCVFELGKFEKTGDCRKSIIERFHKYFLKEKLDISAIPICYQHGDAWSANVFLSNGSLKFIDFDRVGHYPVLFDPFLFAYTEGFFKKNNSIVDSWLNGEFDSLFNFNDKNLINNSKAMFVFNCYVMLLMRHETKGDYKISDEIIHYLESIGVVL